MFWFVLAHLIAFLVDLVLGTRQRDRDKDLQILETVQNRGRLVVRRPDDALRDSRGNSCPESSRLAVVGARVPGDGRVRWN